MEGFDWLGLGGGASGGAQSEAAAFLVDVPLLMFHYVYVTIIGVRHLVNYYYSLCRKPLKTQLMEVKRLRRWFA